MIKNPFIENSAVIFQRDIPKDLLIKEYKKTYNIRIDSLLSSTDKISVYKCQESGYCFFYPFEIIGDSAFYEKLQQFDWYYMSWKWEHQICSKYIKANDKILEVGCGQGGFLEKIIEQHKNIYCVGLELNKSSVSSNEKFKIVNTTIENYSVENKGVFDMVCSFQVLEHIQTVNSFIKANIKCLKDNGLLVISVPNNNGFIKNNKFDILNMPPHHMGLWTEESLLKIGEYFNLELVEITKEPLQEYHFDSYLRIILKKFTGKYPAKIILKTLIFFRLKNTIKTYLKGKANKITGHTILVVFKKTSFKIIDK